MTKFMTITVNLAKKPQLEKTWTLTGKQLLLAAIIRDDSLLSGPKRLNPYQVVQT